MTAEAMAASREQRVTALVPRLDGTVELVPVDGSEVRACPSWIAVAPEVVGLCRSDLKELQGQRHGRSTFGHEIVGRVVAVNRAGPLRVGDRVVHNPNYSLVRTSGFAELFWCGASDPNVLAAAFQTVPTEIDARVMMLAEPLSTASRCADRVQELVQGHAKVGIFAAGMFGSMIALILRAAGYQVTIVNRSRSRLDFLAERGLFEASELRLEADGPGPFDAVVIASSLLDKRQLSLATSATKEGGLVQLFAGTAPGVLATADGVDLDRVRRAELVVQDVIDGRFILLSGSHGADIGNMEQSIAMLSDPAWQDRLVRLIGADVAYADAGRFIADAAKNEHLGKAVIVMPEARAGTGLATGRRVARSFPRRRPAVRVRTA